MYDELNLKINQLKEAIKEKNGNDPYGYNSNCKNRGINKIIYGTPGCGKSFYLDRTILPNLDIINDPDHRIRTIFFSDYSNSDFIGQIYPHIQSDKTVEYVFKPGPFTIALEQAILNIDQPVALIIEEINRGDAASIFGEIFQLLDRDEEGKSRYGITNPAIQDYLTSRFKEMNIEFKDVRIPRNLFIFATMNTSDQGVYALDTAFKRRWRYERVPNEFTASHRYQSKLVPGINKAAYQWNDFVNTVNSFIRQMDDIPNADDKQIGVYFVEEDMLIESPEQDSENVRLDFAFKVLEYLWNDVSKMDHSLIFNPQIHSLDELIAYYKRGDNVFNDSVSLAMEQEKKRRINGSEINEDGPSNV